MSTRTLSCTHRTFSRVGFVCWLQREEKKKKSPSLAKNHTRQALGLYTQFLPTPLTRIIRAHIHYAYLSEVHDRKKEKAMFGCGHLNSGTDTNTMVGDAVQRARQHFQHAYHPSCTQHTKEQEPPNLSTLPVYLESSLLLRIMSFTEPQPPRTFPAYIFVV